MGEVSPEYTTSPLPSVVKPDAIRNAGAVLGSKQFDKMSEEKPDIIVAGSLAVDFSCNYAPLPDSKDQNLPKPHTSNPSVISQSIGGVGFNVATAAKYVGASVLLSSVVADDASGLAALTELERIGMSTDGMQVLPTGQDARTARYVAVNDTKKDLMLAMADMSILEKPTFTPGVWNPIITKRNPKWVVVDANWSPLVLKSIILAGRQCRARIAFEPVSAAKARRLFDKDAGIIKHRNVVPKHMVELATPNDIELSTMYTAAREADLFESEAWWQIIDALGMSSSGSRDRLVAITSGELVDQGVPQQSIQLLPFLPCILTKLGPQGVLMTQLLRPEDPRLTAPESAPYILGRAEVGHQLVGGIYMRLFPPAEVVPDHEIISVNGVGDTLLGVIIAGLASGKRISWEDMIFIAQEASVMTLKSTAAASPSLTDLRPRLESL